MSLIRKNNGAFGQGPVYGDDVVPHFGDYNTAAEVALACARFWQRDEIRGFDENGERIGTGIPRVRPASHEGHDWLFNKKKNKS